MLACRISWNHALPDGNKRVAWLCLNMFVEFNGGKWRSGAPNVNDAVEAMLAVAARQVDEQWMRDWIRQRIVFDAPEE